MYLHNNYLQRSIQQAKINPIIIFNLNRNVEFYIIEDFLRDNAFFASASFSNAARSFGSAKFNCRADPAGDEGAGTDRVSSCGGCEGGRDGVTAADAIDAADATGDCATGLIISKGAVGGADAVSAASLPSRCVCLAGDWVPLSFFGDSIC